MSTSELSTLTAQVTELMELRRMSEELSAEIEALQDAIKTAMGDSESIIAGAFKVTYKAVTSTRIDTAALKKALPEIAAQYSRTTTTRRFTVS